MGLALNKLQWLICHKTKPNQNQLKQKYSHNMENCKGRPTYESCDQKDPDHVEENCSNETKSSNN